jgi:phage terminase large subunit-like protein
MDEQDLPMLDETVARLPQDIRADLATAASNDLFLFAHGVLQYQDMTPHTHGALCRFMDTNEARFKHVEMPRDHLKTSVVTIGNNLRRITRDTNQRILLINETSTNSERFLSAMRQHAESNRVFRALYSGIIPKDTKVSKQWNNKELRFNREWIGPEPTIDTMGMTGAVTSRHFTHIAIDDPISEDAVKSELVMKDAINRITKVMTLMVDPSKDTFDLVGTRWAFADLYRHFMRLYKGKMALFIRGAIEDGEPIWPERFSHETLAQMRADMGEYAFSCLMMNNPRNAEVQDFNIQDLRFWEWADPDEEIVRIFRPDGSSDDVPLLALDVMVAVDPAPAETTSSDRNAVVTVGTSKLGDVIVLDTFAKRCSPLDVIEHLFWLRRRFRPRVFGIEGVAYQKVLKTFLRAEASRRGEYFNIHELKPGGRGKPHIRGLQPVAATGHLYIRATQHVLRNELADWPLGEHDDVADALALSMQMWRGIVSPDRWLRYKASEKELLRRGRRAARRAGIGDPRNALVLPTKMGRLRDPRDAVHPDEVEEEGWESYVLNV